MCDIISLFNRVFLNVNNIFIATDVEVYLKVYWYSVAAAGYHPGMMPIEGVHGMIVL